MTYVSLEFKYTVNTFPQTTSLTVKVRLPNAFRCLEKFQRLEDLKKELSALRDKLQTTEMPRVMRWVYGIHDDLLDFRIRSWEKTYRLAIEEALRKARQEGSLEKWSTRENCAGEYLLASSEKGWDIYRCFRRRDPKQDWVSRSSSAPTLVLIAA
jgi:hypothetical protein